LRQTPPRRTPPNINPSSLIAAIISDVSAGSDNIRNNRTAAIATSMGDDGLERTTMTAMKHDPPAIQRAVWRRATNPPGATL
jgi:hypothetical protein